MLLIHQVQSKCVCDLLMGDSLALIRARRPGSLNNRSLDCLCWARSAACHTLARLCKHARDRAHQWPRTWIINVCVCVCVCICACVGVWVCVCGCACFHHSAPVSLVWLFDSVMARSWNSNPLTVIYERKKWWKLHMETHTHTHTSFAWDAHTSCH